MIGEKGSWCSTAYACGHLWPWFRRKIHGGDKEMITASIALYMPCMHAVDLMGSSKAVILFF